MTEKCAPVKCSLTAKAVLMWLAHHHNAETGRCDPSVELLAQEACMTTRSVGNALKELKALGHIFFTHETGRRHKFTLNPRTTFTPEGDSPPKEIPMAPEGDSDEPPNVVPKPPKEIPTNRKEQESKQELNSKSEFQELILDVEEVKKPIHLEFQEFWNSHAGLPSIREMSATRISALKQRLQSPYWERDWKNAIARISRSHFCLGGNDRQWTANVDYFLRPDSLTKIMEGKFDDKNGTKPIQTTPALGYGPSPQAEDIDGQQCPF